MLRHPDLVLVSLGSLLVLAVVRHVRCTGPYKLPRVLPWRVSKRAVVVWRERLFFGWGRNWLGLSRFAFGRAEDSVGIVGPPRVGKTAGVLVPQAAMWRGALIQTSTKPDVLQATLARRQELARQHGGGVYVYAPTASGPVEGLDPIHWSPLAGCEDPFVAALRASTLVTVADVGRNVENADHWRSGAERILRAYFWAAAVHPATPGDFSLVKRWLSLHDCREPVAILAAHGRDGAKEWADELVGIAERTNEKERASFYAAAETAVKAMGIPSVRRSASGTDFDPVEFIRTRSTLYVVSPSQHQALLAPLISALIESIVVAAYELHGGHRARRAGLRELAEGGLRFLTGKEPAPPAPGSQLPPRLLLQLDELTNIAPLPSLESIVSQGAGQGVLIGWAVQSQAQLVNRYGEHAAGAIFSATSCKVIFGGLTDGPWLEHLSKMIGDHRVPTRSVNIGRDGQRHETRGFEWRPRLTPAELRGLRPKWALLLYHHQGPRLLRAPVAARTLRMRQALRPPAVIAPVVPMPTPVQQLRPVAPVEVRPRVVQLAEPPAGGHADADGREAEVEG